MEKTKKKIKEKKYWYKQYVGDCPVCGSDMGWKERVYGTKPIDLNKIYIQLSYRECYDYCMSKEFL